MNMNSLFVQSIRSGSQLINYQTVRWRRVRKPFWLGIAKTKKFRIPEIKDVSTPEEKNEYQLLKKHYNTQLNSLLHFIREDNPALKARSETKEEAVIISAKLRDEMEKSFKINEEWNNESRKIREIRMKENMEKEMEEAVEKISLEERNRKEHMEVIERIVREEKLLSKTFITPENLDEAIENCLSKVECYDFAIDLKGNKYPGREVLSSKVGDDKGTVSEERTV